MDRDEFYSFFRRAGISREEMNSYSDVEFQNILCGLLDDNPDQGLRPLRRTSLPPGATPAVLDGFGNGRYDEDEALKIAIENSIDDMLVAPHLRQPLDPRNEIVHPAAHPPRGVLPRQNRMGGVPKDLQPKPTPLPPTHTKQQDHPPRIPSSRSNRPPLNLRQPPKPTVANHPKPTQSIQRKPVSEHNNNPRLTSQNSSTRTRVTSTNSRNAQSSSRKLPNNTGLSVRPAPKPAERRNDRNFADLMDAEYQSRRVGANISKPPSARGTARTSSRSKPTDKSTTVERKAEPAKKKENPIEKKVEPPKKPEKPKTIEKKIDPPKKPAKPTELPQQIPDLPNFDDIPPQIKDEFDVPEEIISKYQEKPALPAPSMQEEINLPKPEEREQPKPPHELRESQKIRNFQNLQYEQLVKEQEEKDLEEKRRIQEEEEKKKQEEQNKLAEEHKVEEIMKKMPPEPKDGVTIAVNMNGKRIIRKFSPNQPALHVYAWVASNTDPVLPLDAFELSVVGKPVLDINKSLDEQDVKGRVMLSMMEI
ncbi:hypothetical protein TVAG_259300 [Trichomonas vaginalis G3]|uniref:UBX domain-containing protein n=1 Tax=Trichomonas vaginalis (strain ATCC PRA-98 / G3) TaxID=412133 RepID=A2EBY1_TRIV3|nr:FAS-associated protein family [Trichomonas vaginalis G3]EAY09849.1 hypothetical protein TVAG_259300 [Trichomonas vaginalis G3]KAI5505922.1 FAS-associated protein family [Trichomonas vaginalis G3]|eukprot:XP_001322072.1 hypothetical protein [Trichomonas vaginalis G3]